MNQKTSEKTKTKNRAYGADKWILLFFALSFIGWAYETVYMLLCSGEFQDRGFMSLPFCPIYGVSITAAYLLLGAPDGDGERGLLLRKVNGKWGRYVLYCLFAFLIPSIAELAVGWVFDKRFHTTLWDYSGIPLNIGGYVCAPVSFAWALMLFAFMKWCFLPLKKGIGKLPKKISVICAVGICLAAAIDLFVNFSKVI
jgi:uncharacterized membrane protein